MFPPPMREVQRTEISPDIIPIEVRSEVVNIVRASIGRSPYLPYDDEFWLYGNQTTSYGRGSWVKRFSRYMKTDRGITLDSDTLGAIGDTVGGVMSTVKEYLWDITDTIDWNAGDFGDDGSCFFTYNGHLLNLLRQNGCLAVRAFGEQYNNEGLDGIARAFMLPCRDLPAWLLFNGMGSLTTRQFALILAKSNVGLAYVAVDTSCSSGLGPNDRRTGFYTNSYRNYLLGPPEVVYGAGGKYHIEFDILEE